MSVRTPGEIFSRRLIAAIAGSVLVQIVFSRVLALFLRLDILHPGSWVAESIRAFSLMTLVQVTFVTAAQVYIFAYSCVATPRRRFSRFSMLLDLFTLRNMSFSLLYALSGYLTNGFYSSILDGRFGDLRKLCTKSEGQCLVEESLFLECAGVWLGLYFFLKMHIFGSTILFFPHVHQEKIHQIRGSIIGNTLQGFRESVRPTFYFLVFYIVWGSKPRNVIRDIYSLYLEDAPLDSIFNLLGSGIWFILWLYSSLFFVAMYNMRTVFNTFLTEPMQFPISSTATLTLQEGLSQRWKYSGMLAAQDYRQMACADACRRREVFTVSLPGGHPRTWAGLLHETLTTIDSFSEELEDINGSNENQPDSFSLPNASYPYRFPSTIRDMANYPQLKSLKDYNRNKLDGTATDKLKATLKVYAQSQLQKLLQNPIIGYVFRELPDWKLKSLLSRAQPVMWTCEGLAFVTAASLYEDQYGIVQNDLPAILESLVRLKQNIEKLTKTGLLPKKQSNDAFTVKMKKAILSSVRRSIYKITHTFSMYINDISLSPELQRAIQPFLAFREY